MSQKRTAKGGPCLRGPLRADLLTKINFLGVRPLVKRKQSQPLRFFSPWMNITTDSIS